MSNFISLNTAKQMIARYRNEKEKLQNGDYKGRQILPFSESFDASQFQPLLTRPGCTSLRVYYGMGDDLQIRLIIVSMDANNNDVINLNQAEENSILEEGQLCPPLCPPPPPPPPPGS